MSRGPDTPFDSIEGALEYVNLLREAIGEAQEQVEGEIARSTEPQLARRKQALQLASYNIGKLSGHISASHRILNDLRTLRRLLLEERESRQAPPPSQLAARQS